MKTIKILSAILNFQTYSLGKEITMDSEKSKVRLTMMMETFRIINILKNEHPQCITKEC